MYGLFCRVENTVANLYTHTKCTYPSSGNKMLEILSISKTERVAKINICANDLSSKLKGVKKQRTHMTVTEGCVDTQVCDGDRQTHRTVTGKYMGL